MKPQLTPTDFGDWLSPILVKELRQGLKTRMFVTTFILVQVIMILIVGFQLLNHTHGSSPSSMESFDGFFWAFIGFPLLALMPARGLTAISEELKANTLDLVQLTRLTAFRIVLGKWIALVAQTLLLVAAILPYTVLRYFFGKVEVVSDLLIIAYMLMASIVLTAGAIALSSAALAIRILILAVGVPFAFSMGGALVIAASFGGSRPFMGAPMEWWMALMAMVVYVILFLEMASSKIAPASENHAARKRLLAILLAVGGVLCAALGERETAENWASIFFPLWLWVVLEALSERTVLVPSIYAPFTKRGFIGKLAGRVLYPGWASGLFFTAILFTMEVLAYFLRDMTQWSNALNAAEAAFLALIIFTAIITPVCVFLMFPGARQPVWLYIFTQGIFLLIFAIANIVIATVGVDKEIVFRWLAPFPATAFLAWSVESSFEQNGKFYAFVTLPVCLLIIAYLLLRARHEFRIVKILERRAMETSPKS